MSKMDPFLDNCHSHTGILSCNRCIRKRKASIIQLSANILAHAYLKKKSVKILKLATVGEIFHNYH